MRRRFRFFAAATSGNGVTIVILTSSASGRSIGSKLAFVFRIFALLCQAFFGQCQVRGKACWQNLSTSIACASSIMRLEGIEGSQRALRQKACFLTDMADRGPGARVPVSRAMRSSVSMVVRPIPRVGTLITRAQCDRVMLILYQLQVADQVLDFGAIVKREAPDHGVGECRSGAGLLQSDRDCELVRYSTATRGVLDFLAGLTEIFLDVVRNV